MMRFGIACAWLLTLLLYSACASDKFLRIGGAPVNGEWLEITLCPNPEVYPRHFGIRYPQLAIWITTQDGTSPQSLFVTRKSAANNWIGAKTRPEALPLWEGMRQTQTAAQVDAVSGATPQAETIVLLAPLPHSYQGQTLRVFLEANVSFDFNAQYPKPSPDDPAPKTSAVNGQPSILYQAEFGPTADGLLHNPAIVGVGDALGERHETLSDSNGLTSARFLFKRLAVRRLTAKAK